MWEIVLLNQNTLLLQKLKMVS